MSAPDDAMYRRVFEDSREGALILEDLIRQFAMAAVLDGDNAALKTYYNCGTNEVTQYIVRRINRANKGDVNVSDDSTDLDD